MPYAVIVCIFVPVILDRHITIESFKSVMEITEQYSIILFYILDCSVTREMWMQYSHASQTHRKRPI